MSRRENPASFAADGEQPDGRSGRAPGSPALDWRRVTERFDRLLRVAPEEREGLLAEAGAECPDLQTELRSLLAASAAADEGFLAPVVDLTAPAAADDRPPATVGSYRVLREIGRGGMSRVYLAERSDEVFRKLVAVKVARPGVGGHLERLVHERQVLADLEHPNIARILDGGTTADGRPYLVMEHVEGAAIDDHCRQQFGLAQRLRLFVKVCGAVQAAHNRLVLHGDLKPANVLVTAEDEPKVIDFGVAASLGEPTPAPGATPGFAAPEQLRGEPVTAAVDVYALGGILEGLVSDAKDRPATLLGWTTSVLGAGGEAGGGRRLRLPRGDLGRIVRKATAASPEERYGSAQELAQDVGRFLRDEPTSVSRYSVVAHARRAVRRHPLAAGLLGLVLVGAVVVAQQWRRDQAEAARRAEVTRKLFAIGNELVDLARRDALLPVHPRAEVVGLLEERRAEVAAVDDLGTGATAYALGCSDYALGRYGSARERFEAAMAAGFEPESTGLFLARTLFQLYREALAQHYGEPVRRRVTEELDRLYRAPALGYLTVAGAASEADAEHLGALTAFYDHRYDEAAARSRSAFASSPWLYEAKQLEAEALIARAWEADRAGDAAASEELLEGAGDAYERGLEVGRSDPSLWTGECSRRRRVLERLGNRGEGKIGDRAGWAAEPCEHALTIDPGYVGAELELGAIHLEAADVAMRGWGDPMPGLALAAEAAQRASSIAPRDVRAHRLMARTAYVQARALIYRDETGVESVLDRGEEALRAALGVEPDNPDFLQDLGNLTLVRAVTGRRHADWEKALELYSRAAAIDDKAPKHVAALCAAHMRRALDQLATGVSPEKSIEAALDACDRTLALAPDDVVALGSRAWAAVARAESRHLTGEATDEDFRFAEEAISGMPPSRPDRLYFGAQLAATHACFLVDRSTDPGDAVKVGSSLVHEAMELDPGQPEDHEIEARLLLATARYRERSGRTPLGELDAASAALDRAEEVGSPLPLLRAEVALRRARWLQHAGLDPSAVLDETQRHAAIRDRWSPRSLAHAHVLLAAVAAQRWHLDGDPAYRAEAMQHLASAGAASELYPSCLVDEVEEALGRSGGGER